jgi:hypothetical protein
MLNLKIKNKINKYVYVLYFIASVKHVNLLRLGN